MPDEVILDVTTIEENVTVETTAGDVVEIQVVAPTGTAATVAVGTTTTGAAGTNASVTNSGTTSAAVFNFTIPRGNTGATGATGAAGPNSVTSATTSDGTANLSIADLEVVGGEIYTDGDYSQIYTQGTDAHIFTLGAGAEIFTVGEVATIATQGANATISTAGAGATIGTQGANATIYTQGTNATISTAGSAAHIQTSHANAAVKSTNFAAVESGGASLVDGSFQPCLTWSAGGRNLTIPSGTATTFNTTSYTYGTGAAAAHVNALGLPTSSSIVTLTGTQELLNKTLTSPTIGTSATFNATTYTYGAGAALAHRNALGVGTRISALASNTSVTNTTTLQTVASLSVVAGKSYAVYAQIAIDGTVLTGTRHGLTFPASTFIRMTRKRSSSYIPVEVTANLNLGLAETSTLAELVGFISVTVTGTVDLQFAQNTANANTTTCRTFTFLTLTELV